MKGLAPHTTAIFDAVTKLECIKPFVLVGGTALSLQIGSRLSEDLDFMRWKLNAKDKLEIGWPNIQRELSAIGTVEHTDVRGFDMAEFYVNGVKLSFYAAPRKRLPSMQLIPYSNNLVLADAKSIGAMKMEIMSRRSKFRDYYDIYCILKSGADIHEMIAAAIEHSGHALKTKNLMAILTNGERFVKDQSFLQLEPKFDVSACDIQEFIKSLLKS